MSKMLTTQLLKLALCLTGVFLNITFNRICFFAGFPLYLDTVMTITVTLACGLPFGILCGALTNIISHSIFGHGWEAYLFAICNIATAFLTWFFYRFFKQELTIQEQTPSVRQKSSQLNRIMDRVIILIFLSFTLCLAMSILGGLIAAFILNINSAYFETDGITGVFSATMFVHDVPIVLKEIIARIPVNMIDRLISVFAGYGIAFFGNKLWELLKKIRKN